MKILLSILEAVVFIVAVGLMASPYIYESVNMDTADWTIIVAVAVILVSLLEFAKTKIDPAYVPARGIKIMATLLLVPILFFVAMLFVAFSVMN